MKIRFRLANEEDISSIVDLNISEYWKHREIWSNSTQIDRWKRGSWWADSELLVWYFEILKSTNGGIILALDKDDIIGELDYTISFDHTHKFEGLRAHIIWLLVNKKYRREGIAKMLIGKLADLVDYPIWVEPEDNRTVNLYNSLGHKFHTISNWQLSFQSLKIGNVDIIQSNSSYKSMLNKIDNGWKMLIGRYYAPYFDILQLSESRPVHEFIWGNTFKADVIKYKLDRTVVYAVLTQYPRIIVNPSFDYSNLEIIFVDILARIFSMGFDVVYIQIYNHIKLLDMIRGIGFSPIILDDELFELD